MKPLKPPAPNQPIVALALAVVASLTGDNGNDRGNSCSLLGQAGQWRMQALGQTSFNFGADGNNAHV